ncbi:hypothetical protein Salat_0842000 [Sesamum alatum]|uniref:Uncharacterized protein n=1 Tax=Sesamum alatum TaxID=300844 RepID=A0AAE2CQI3_9LAMI|nr:hypothetical protein Salat_0842000 [Sesamum alatum]
MAQEARFKGHSPNHRQKTQATSFMVALSTTPPHRHSSTEDPHEEHIAAGKEEVKKTTAKTQPQTPLKPPPRRRKPPPAGVTPPSFWRVLIPHFRILQKRVKKLCHESRVEKRLMACLL